MLVMIGLFPGQNIEAFGNRDGLNCATGVQRKNHASRLKTLCSLAFGVGRSDRTDHGVKNSDIAVRLRGGSVPSPPRNEVPMIDALIGAAQMNVIEFHTWNSRAQSIDKPDRMIFDLDPGEGVEWAAIQEAAVLTRTMLTQLGLECWLKTSGGKGLHVVVPLSPKLDYAAVSDCSRDVVVHMAKTIP